MKKILILKGGWSTERSVSLKSGENMAKIIKDLGYDVFELDVVKNLKFITEELYRIDPDYIVNLLHGTGGEDGVIQGLLEIFGKPYSNCPVLSSAICFNKAITKTLVKAVGVPVPNFIALLFSDFKKMPSDKIPFNFPFIIKPCSGGSSIGLFLLHSEEELKKLQQRDWEFEEDILLEEFIPGREFTILVQNNKTIGGIEITTDHEVYDYSTKYDEGASAHLLDFKMPEDHKQKMFKLAELAYKACKCQDFVRIDFRYDGKEVYFLEINTQPGMTSASLVPDIIRYNNIPWEDILELK